MNIIGYSITFFVSWWLIFFMVLPFGVQTHNESDEEIKDGIEVGSPVKANIKQKMLVTTGIAILFTLLVGFIDYLDLITIR